MKKLNCYTMLCIIMATGIILSACQKSSVKPKPKTTGGIAVGYWYGSFSNNNGAGANEGILFRNDGTLKIYDFYGALSSTDTTQTSLIATGTFTISGNIVSFKYSFPGEAFTAQGTINTSANPAAMPYTFTDPNSTNLSGTATLTQQSN